METLQIEIKSRRLSPNLAAVELIGECDVYTAPKFREAVDRLIDDGVTYLALALTKTEYLDSTALGALVRALKRVRERGGDIDLVDLPDRVRRPLEITHLIDIFTVTDTTDEAIADLVEKGATAP
jgi:anti-sigma B factor antagonist